MAKQKKKRKKVYTGNDSTVTRPTITRVSAVNRNKLQQWWCEKKRIVKPVGIASGVAGVVVGLSVELVSVIG